MDRVKELLKGIKTCTGCWLMADNNHKGVPFDLDGIISRANEKANIMFVGRDANPGSNNNGYFYKKINYMIKEAKSVQSQGIHISNVIKCHFYKSGSPYPNTEGRENMPIEDVANSCLEKWLIKEIKIINPKIVIFFARENYEVVLNKYIEFPKIQFDSFEYIRKADNSLEYWQGKNGPLTVNIEDKVTFKAFILRHPASIVKLKDNQDKMEKYEILEERVIDYLSSLK